MASNGVLDEETHAKLPATPAQTGNNNKRGHNFTPPLEEKENKQSRTVSPSESADQHRVNTGSGQTDTNSNEGDKSGISVNRGEKTDQVEEETEFPKFNPGDDLSDAVNKIIKELQALHDRVDGALSYQKALSGLCDENFGEIASRHNETVSMINALSKRVSSVDDKVKNIRQGPGLGEAIDGINYKFDSIYRDLKLIKRKQTE